MAQLFSCERSPSEVTTANDASSPHHRRFGAWQRFEPFEPRQSAVRVSLLSDVPELGHSFLSFPDFLWAHRSGNSSPVIPLRSGLRVFCFHGSSPHYMGPSHKADASLRLHAPSLSLVPQRKRGRKKGKRQCPIYMLSGIELRGDSPPTVSVLKHALRLRGHSRSGAL